MEEINFYKTIEGTEYYLPQFKNSLITLIDKVLNGGVITSEEELGKLARFRAKVVIEL